MKAQSLIDVWPICFGLCWLLLEVFESCCFLLGVFDVKKRRNWEGVWYREKQIFERGFECRFSGQPWQNLSFSEIRPLDRSENFTAGSQHIALHLDGSDRQSELLIICYCSWCNLRFLGDISQFLFSFVLALMYVGVGGLWHPCRLIWVSLPSIFIIREEEGWTPTSPVVFILHTEGGFHV